MDTAADPETSGATLGKLAAKTSYASILTKEDATTPEDQQAALVKLYQGIVRTSRKGARVLCGPNGDAAALVVPSGT